MFEDALVESSGRLQSKSRYWMLATFAFNLLTVALLILIPLLHPEALPKTAMTAMLTAPPPPPLAPPSTPVRAIRPVKVVEPLNAMTAPAQIPRRIDTSDQPPASLVASTGVMGGATDAANGPVEGVFGGLGISPAPVVVARQPERPKPSGPIKISSGVAAGSILVKTTPVYPAIAKAAHISGAVVLHAVISKTGRIESLQVISGPEMLRAGALEAVRQWRYKPYLLNGEPTEVDTAVTVNFSFGGQEA